MPSIAKAIDGTISFHLSASLGNHNKQKNFNCEKPRMDVYHITLVNLKILLSVAFVYRHSLMFSFTTLGGGPGISLIYLKTL